MTLIPSTKMCKLTSTCTGGRSSSQELCSGGDTKAVERRLQAVGISHDGRPVAADWVSRWQLQPQRGLRREAAGKGEEDPEVKGPHAALAVRLASTVLSLIAFVLLMARLDADED